MGKNNQKVVFFISIFLLLIGKFCYAQASLADSKLKTAVKLSKNVDVNLDWIVDIKDVASIALQYNQKVLGTNKYNINGDGIIDLYDLTQVSKLYGSHLTLNTKLYTEQWENYVLPKSINASYDNGTNVDLPISWNSSGVNTEKVGLYNCSGVVQDYNSSFSAVVEVLPIKINFERNSNIMNAGIVDQYGEWVYYCNIANEGKLSKAKMDGSEVAKISDDLAMDINAEKDWIYYINFSDDNTIYKIRPDGTEKTKLFSGQAEDIIVSGSWIYFQNGDNGYKLYKIRTDGTQLQKLNENESFYINVVGNWIYFVNYSDNGKLYKVKIDGTCLTKINDDECGNMYVLGEWAYYQSIAEADNGFYKIRIDGTDKTKIGTIDMAFFNVIGDYVYYGNLSDSGKMYRLKIDGTCNEKVSDSLYPLSINQLNGQLYFFEQSNGFGLYRCNQDGSGENPFGVDTVIKSIAGVTESVTQGDYYELPSKVSCVMSDGSTQYRDVSWNSYIIDTNQLGTFNYKGSVNGCDIVVSLSVSVIEKGNTNGNLLNESFIVEKDGWVYYVNNLDKHLYKVKQDGTGATILCSDEVGNINLISDWIYYINKSDGNKIYKIKTDGSAKSKLYDYDADRLFSAGDSNYFQSFINRYVNWSYINKAKIDGSTVTMLGELNSADEAASLNIAGDWIYYLNSNDNFKIYATKSDGSFKVKLSDFSASSMILEKNKVVLLGKSDNKMYTFNLVDGTLNKISDDVVEYFNVYDNYIYYPNKQDGNKLYRIATDGTGKMKLSDDSLYVPIERPTDGGINVTKDWVYYKNSLDNKIYRVTKDGAKREVFGDCNIVSKIDDLRLTIAQNTAYELPSTVIAHMTDGSIKEIPITWNQKSIDTSKIGTYILEGTVNNYSSKVVFTLNVAIKEIRGNTGGNLSDWGFVAQENGWIYYINYEDEAKIYKMSSDGTNKGRVIDLGYCTNLNVIDGWIYFVRYDGVYKVKIDGTGFIRLLSDCYAKKLSVVGDYIFFVEGNDNNRIYRMKLDGTEKVRLSTDLVGDCFEVNNGWIYYSNDKLYKIRIDGTDKRTITDDILCDFSISNNYIYYSLGYGTSYKIKTDGTGKTKLGDNFLGTINVFGDWVIYRGDYNLCRMRVDGSSKMILDSFDVSNICMIDYWVYWIQGSKVYRIMVDGTGKQAIN